MQDQILGVVIIDALLLVGAAFLAGMSYCGYSGRWRRFLTMQPFLLPLGRYWGLLTSAAFATAVLWTGISTTMQMLTHDGSIPPLEGFWVGTFPAVVFGSVGILFSWWLPYRLRPQWLIEHDQGTRYDPAVKAATAEMRKQHAKGS